MLKEEDRTKEWVRAVGLTRRGLKPGRKGKPTCADCFFHRNELCALDLGSPCSTFRPDTPTGLVPPRQPALLLRQGAN
ncbi:MAG: hypothetical protein QOI31_1818 [Solirubrobacterales bacterium]|jgi:hypothetical protein|nr:hypothetical protein [Solirubrobacterales bacterium]